MTRFENVGVFIREKVWLENSLNQWLRLFMRLLVLFFGEKLFSMYLYSASSLAGSM